jgi:hypothetical protein
VDKWCDYVPQVYDQVPGDVLGEMFAYSLAAADLELPHVLLEEFMVSKEGEAEAWPLVDDLIARNRHSMLEQGGQVCDLLTAPAAQDSLPPIWDSTGSFSRSLYLMPCSTTAVMICWWRRSRHICRMPW